MNKKIEIEKMYTDCLKGLGLKETDIPNGCTNIVKDVHMYAVGNTLRTLLEEVCLLDDADAIRAMQNIKNQVVMFFNMKNSVN